MQKYQYFEWGSTLNLDGFKIIIFQYITCEPFRGIGKTRCKRMRNLAKIQISQKNVLPPPVPMLIIHSATEGLSTQCWSVHKHIFQWDVSCQSHRHWSFPLWCFLTLLDSREDACSRTGGIFIRDTALDTAYSLWFNELWPNQGQTMRNHTPYHTAYTTVWRMILGRMHALKCKKLSCKSL